MNFPNNIKIQISFFKKGGKHCYVENIELVASGEKEQNIHSMSRH
jgi:hypothetical protein